MSVEVELPEQVPGPMQWAYKYHIWEPSKGWTFYPSGVSPLLAPYREMWAIKRTAE